MPTLTTNNLFPIILFVATGLILLFIYLRNLAKVRASQTWPTAQGTVIKSWVGRKNSTDSDGSRSTQYYPEIHYLYEIMGSEYQGNRIRFGPKVGGRSQAKKMVEKYPTGASVTIYYQPDSPNNAILERSISKIPLFMGIVFVLAGIFFYVRWG